MENATNYSIAENELLEQNDDLKELKLAQGINVWSTNQEVLEGQALKELEKFAEDHNNKSLDNLEEGEIVEEDDNGIVKKSGEGVLDIENYIKRQADLKKRQEYKKSLEVSEQSKELASKICSKISKHRKAKRRKHNSLDNSKRQSNSNGNNKNNAEPSSSHCEVDCLETTSEIAKVGVDVRNSSIDCNEDKSGSEYLPSEEGLDSDYEEGYKHLHDTETEDLPKTTKKKRKISKLEHMEKVKDDGLLQCYKSRLDLYYKNLETELSLKQLNDDGEDAEDEFHLLNGGLKIPIKIWDNLYCYQQDGLKWLWKIHQKPTGGLLGDEMGLGKTVQIIAFLHSLEYSRISSCHGRFIGLGPTLIVCPATVIHQWVKHFHDWSPEFRVAVLHQSGNFQGNKADLIREMHKCKGIIITTYHGILKYKGNLLEYTWHYIVLDEGHKIRNPTAKVSVAVKHFRTPHRIMLTGSPMQNNLTELWSLFDFTNPGMLGNLTTFQEHFANPILHGGFANSTSMQEATALSVATTLKNIISPYLLRRSKNEVQHHISLPNKSEQVLFCSLTHEQRDLYKGYLMSEHVNMILGRGSKNWFSENHMRANVLVAITTLRKICNHPDIYLCEADDNNIRTDEATPVEERFGYYKRSGKMVVVSALLKIWKKQGHRVLLFTQGRSMIRIFQDFLEQQGYKYLKMDGTTSISSRQPLINKFNEDPSYDAFLLTTRVGGLGVNLTGANRVIIFDPDWNPATDTQARERAWRIGQEKQVTIYRLLSAGTIEEKMYQRQVWKQLLSNKVLLDPKTNRFFKTSDLHDLFSLQESTDADSETANIFRNSRVRIQEKIKRKGGGKKKSKSKLENVPSEVQFTEDKIQAMKNLAQQIAKSLSHKKEEPPVTRTSYQLELEEERQRKLKEKEELKKLTAQQLLFYNKEKAKRVEGDAANEIDGCATDASFSKALEYSETTAKLHHVLNSGKVKDPEVVVEKVVKFRNSITKTKDNKPLELSKKECTDNAGNDILVSKAMSEDDSSSKECYNEKKRKYKKKRRHRDKAIVDVSGTIDGEEVECLVKSEIKKNKREKHRKTNEASQDDFVLGKLFSKKGVSGALQHDTIVQSGYQGRSLKVHTEAKNRAERSLEALRKSRIDNWRW